jgi:hypothetical protein
MSGEQSEGFLELPLRQLFIRSVIATESLDAASFNFVRVPVRQGQ